MRTAGLKYSLDEDTFTFADNLPLEWSFMEFNVPVVTAGGEEAWVRCRVERDEARVKTVTVTSNPFATLAIRPWLEEAELAWAAPDTAQEPAPPPGHLGWVFGPNTAEAEVKIALT